MGNYMKRLATEDPALAKAINQELGRQRDKIELIASENFTSPAVMEAQGSILTNKYAEGYSGKRYYGGCEYIDIVEDLACDRAKEIFGAEHANMQPHSGANANMAAYLAFLKAGDKVLGMSLDHGGHLTHGSAVNMSGLFFNFAAYGVDTKNEKIDYDEVRKVAKAEKPKLLVAGASAYPRTIDFAAFADIAKEVGAIFMVDMAHIAGLVAAGEHPSPVPHADVVTSTTHKTLRGPRAGMILCKEEHAAAINKAVFPGLQGGPLMHVIAAKAVAFKEALDPSFKEYQKQVIANAQALAEGMLDAGFRLVSGGTDNHLILIDLTNRDITGKDATEALDSIGITCNKNTIPNETRSPFVTSGIRLGTPAMTTRGLKEEDMLLIAKAIDLTLSKDNIDANRKKAQEIVNDITKRFPLYEEYK